jgi:type IV pilus assembly protein PilY1
MPSAGERTVGNPVFALGQITFTTNVFSSNACSSSSYIYILSKTGNQVSQNVQGVKTYGGYMIGQFTVSRPIIIRLPSGKVVAEFHKSSGDVQTTSFSSSNRPPRTVSWKEILR